MHVVIVPDKFKGTLTAKQAAQAIRRGWKRARPDDIVDMLPMSDGGDGFGNVMSSCLGAKVRRVKTVDAAHRPCHARWWWDAHTSTAIIESAQVIGLAMLPAGRFHPFELDTMGLARVLAAAGQLEPSRCLIGIGGSATNDGGFGLARALGWRFLTQRGNEVHAWPNLTSCCEIIPPPHNPKLGRLVAALDVQNPLLGPEGCTRIYGPQKGVRPRDLARAEASLSKLSQLMNRQDCKSLATVAGAGAAGGLGFGLMAFLDAEPMMGFSLFAQEAELRRRIRDAELVITGEGCLNQQSLMGKGVGELVAFCEGLRIPCIAMCGKVELSQTIRDCLVGVYSMSMLTEPLQALNRPAHWLAKVATKAASDFSVR